MKKIIVIGGAGFIGTNLCLSALRKNLSVVVFDNFLRKGAELNLKVLETAARSGLVMIRGDIRDDKAIQELFTRHGDADAVFHLAGQVAVTTSVLNPREDFETNLTGTFNVLEAARLHSYRGVMLYASTNKVYGSLPGTEMYANDKRYFLKNYPEGINERQQLDFHSPYGCSKGAADQYFIDYARIYNLKTVVFRQSCIYGYYQFGIEDQGWVAWFTIAGLFNKPITIYGDGKQVRDVLFIDDLVDAYWKAIACSDETFGQVYNIGGSRFQMSLLELLEYLEDFLQRKIPVRYEKQRQGDQRVYVSDIRKAEAVFGWRPTIDVRQGVGMLADWMMSNKNLFLQAGILQ